MPPYEMAEGYGKFFKIVEADKGIEDFALS